MTVEEDKAAGTELEATEAEAGWNWAPLMQRQREKNGAKVGLGVLAAETGAAEEITGKEWEVGITEDCSAAH